MTAVLLDDAPVVSDLGCPLGALLQQTAVGAEGAFAELHRLTRVRLHAVVLRVVRSPELASEVTQEVYLVIWQQSGRFRTGEGSALGWMVTIARRRAIDRVRSVCRASAQEHRWAASTPPGTVDDWDAVVDRLDATRVLGALDRLTWRQREALVLVHLEQRPVAEAAGLLGIPVNTAKTRVRDGLQRLRVVLADA